MRSFFSVLFGAVSCVVPMHSAMASTTAEAPKAEPADKPKAKDADGLSIHGSVRARIEAIGGQFRPGAPEDDALLSLRTLVTAKYRAGDLHIVGELNDARTFFHKSNSYVSSGEINALEPLQAYVGLDLGSIGGVKGKGVVRAGRFTTKVGSGRLIDRTDWYNSPYSFLGVELDWKSKRGDRVHAFVTQPFERLPYSGERLRDAVVELDRTSPALRLSGLSLTGGKLFASANVEAFGIWLDEDDSASRQTRNRELFTFGSRIYRYPTAGTVDFEFEGALQHGSIRNSTSASDLIDHRVRAGMAHAEIGFSGKGAHQPRFAVIFDYASGDTRGSSYTRYDALYGKRRSDFGPISLYSAVNRGNVVSPGLLIEAKTGSGWDLMLKGRKFWLASATDTLGTTGVRDATGASGKDAGGQIEWAVGTDLIKKRVRAEFGSAWLIKGPFLQNAPSAPRTGDSLYGFFDLTASF